MSKEAEEDSRRRFMSIPAAKAEAAEKTAARSSELPADQLPEYAAAGSSEEFE